MDQKSMCWIRIIGWRPAQLGWGNQLPLIYWALPSFMLRAKASNRTGMQGVLSEARTLVLISMSRELCLQEMSPAATESWMGVLQSVFLQDAPTNPSIRVHWSRTAHDKQDKTKDSPEFRQPGPAVSSTDCIPCCFLCFGESSAGPKFVFQKMKWLMWCKVWLISELICSKHSPSAIEIGNHKILCSIEKIRSRISGSLILKSVRYLTETSSGRNAKQFNHQKVIESPDKTQEFESMPTKAKFLKWNYSAQVKPSATRAYLTRRCVKFRAWIWNSSQRNSNQERISWWKNPRQIRKTSHRFDKSDHQYIQCFQAIGRTYQTSSPAVPWAPVRVAPPAVSCRILKRKVASTLTRYRSCHLKEVSRTHLFMSKSEHKYGKAT